MSKTGPKDVEFLYAVGIGHLIDLAQFLFSRIIECSTNRREESSSKAGFVLGSLISSILIFVWKVRKISQEPHQKNNRSVYNKTSWNKSLRQAQVYEQVDRPKGHTRQ